MTVMTPGGTATARRTPTWPRLAHDLPRLRHPRPGDGLTDLVQPRRDRHVGPSARLLAVVYCEDHYPDRFPRSAHAWLVDDVLSAWVAEWHGRILGHVATVRVGTDPLAAARWREVTGLAPGELLGVGRFFVRASERGRGIGSALLAAARSDIRAQGLRPVLETVTESREPIPALKEAGWQLLAIDARDPRGTRWWVHRYAAARG